MINIFFLSSRKPHKLFCPFSVKHGLLTEHFWSLHHWEQLLTLKAKIQDDGNEFLRDCIMSSEWTIISYCYIPRLYSTWGTATGWFLVTWPWLKSNVSRSWYIKQCTLFGLHNSMWSKHGGKWHDRRQEKHPQILPFFFSVNEHNNTNTKPQVKRQQFLCMRRTSFMTSKFKNQRQK